jgi:prephenate dehydrogenase
LGQAHLGTAPLSRWTIAEHDDAVAWVSHLPFLVSRALARLVERERPAALALAGPGYRDTSRVGRSDVSLMRPMLLANQAVLREALVALQEEIERTAAELLCEQNSPSEGT